MILLRCVPEGHLFRYSLSFGESLNRIHCPECDREVAARKA